MQGKSFDKSGVLAELSAVKDPETGRSLTEMDQVTDVVVTPEAIRLQVHLTTHSAPLWEETIDEVRNRLQAAFPQAAEIEVTRAVLQRPPEKLGQIGLTAKSVVVVGSGKGGVGKSTVATALAYGLHRKGSVVGLVDADVYGPSVPHLLGLEGRPEVHENRIQPIEKQGMKVMSMGFLVPPGEAVVWRGPMLHGAITQFLRDTAWGELDYLVIDMPPGTGDIALTLSQLVPLSGAVVVCTPQQVALLDAVKAIAMFQKVNIPLLGMVENMSGFVCPDNQKHYPIFGKGGAEAKAAEMNFPFLGELPINMSIRESGDDGRLDDLGGDETVQPYLDRIVQRFARSLADRVKQDPPLPTLSVL